MLWQRPLAGGSLAFQSTAGPALARRPGNRARSLRRHHRTYTDDLSCYLAWLDENSLGLDDVGLEHIRDYIAVARPARLLPDQPSPDASQWRAACTGL